MLMVGVMVRVIVRVRMRTRGLKLRVLFLLYIITPTLNPKPYPPPLTHTEVPLYTTRFQLVISGHYGTMAFLSGSTLQKEFSTTVCPSIYAFLSLLLFFVTNQG
jgi:hypothetical protein